MIKTLFNAGAEYETPTCDVQDVNLAGILCSSGSLENFTIDQYDWENN